MRKIEYTNFILEEDKMGVVVYDKDYTLICLLTLDHIDDLAKEELFSGDESKAKEVLDRVIYFMEIITRQLTKLIS